MWLILALAACTPKAESEAAVRQALNRYLASRPNLNMAGMEVQVGAVRFRNQKAEAEVSFRSRTDAKATMSMTYTLRRQGPGWEVEPQSAAHEGMTPPPAPTAELPPGHPPTSAPPADIPHGHPPASPPAADLPPGHPPVKKQ